jgi:hypothetical protein
LFVVVRQRSETHAYQGRSRKDHRGLDLISDALPFGRLWYADPASQQQTPRLSRLNPLANVVTLTANIAGQ